MPPPPPPDRATLTRTAGAGSSPTAEIPIGGTSDLLVALSNSGSKMFNVTRIEGHFVKNGEVAIPLDTYTYGQNVEPRQQRSFRFPIALAEDTPLGEYTLVAKIFYATRDKMPFVSPVCDEPTELVPALPKGDTAAMLMQAGIGGLVVLAVGALTMGGGKGGDAGKGGGKGGGRSRDGGSGGGGGGGGGARPAEVESSEWLRGTLAGTESTTPKKAKKK